MTTTIYSVDFTQFNLQPTIGKPWGDMKIGESLPSAQPVPYTFANGLSLWARRLDPALPAVSRTVSLVHTFQRDLRLGVTLDFVSPEFTPPTPPGPPETPQQKMSGTVVPPNAGLWGIGISFKTGNEYDQTTDKSFSATCQVRPGGARLNLPGLIPPASLPDFSILPSATGPWPGVSPSGPRGATPFSLHLDLDRSGPAGGPAPANAVLRIGPHAQPYAIADCKQFVSGNMGETITAISASVVVTSAALGTAHARLLRFTLTAG